MNQDAMNQDAMNQDAMNQDAMIRVSTNGLFVAFFFQIGITPSDKMMSIFA